VDDKKSTPNQKQTKRNFIVLVLTLDGGPMDVYPHKIVSTRECSWELNSQNRHMWPHMTIATPSLHHIQIFPSHFQCE
jgi:hypothetical protein